MRAFVLSFVVSAILASPSVAVGQEQVPVWYATDFDGERARPFEGDMQANWGGDGWARTGDGAVKPTTDELRGGFGEPVDSFENFLLMGDDSWDDVVMQTVVVSRDDDAVGLVARYSGAGSYYACLMTRDRWPSCDGRGHNVQPALGLMRVDTDQDCDGDYVIDAADGAALLERDEPYLMHLQVIGGRIFCGVDVDGDGSFDGEDDVLLGGEDPNPLPGGKAGLAALDSEDTRFESFIIGGPDDDAPLQDDPEQAPEERPEDDPGPAPVPDRDNDGLPDAVEGILGSDPNDPDSDDDGLLDGIEPDGGADTDQDGLLNLLDPDSDNDGMPDGMEDANHNGLVDEGETDPLVPDDFDDLPPGDDPPPPADDPPPPADEAEPPVAQPDPPAADPPPPAAQPQPQPTPQAQPQPQAPPQPQAQPQARPDRPVAEEEAGLEAEGQLFVAGGGCSQGGAGARGSWLIALFVLAGFALRRRAPALPTAFPAALLAALLLPAFAQAMPAERFRVASGADALLDVETGGVAPGTAISAGLWVGQSSNSLVLMRQHDNGAVERVGALVGERTLGTLSAGVAVKGMASLELRAPMLLGQRRDDVDAVGVGGGVEASGMGDLELAPKVSLLGADKLGVDVALLAGITLPTGDAGAFVGEEGPSLAPELAVSRRHGALRWAVNLGARLRKETRIGDANLGSEFVTRAGLGLAHTFASRRFELAGTASYAVQAGGFGAAELFAGLTADVLPNLQAFAGAGGGIIPGAGAPDRRIALGVRYTHRPGTSPGASASSAARPAPLPAPAPARASDEDLLMDDPIDPLGDLFAAEEESQPGAIEFEPDDLSAD